MNGPEKSNSFCLQSSNSLGCKDSKIAENADAFFRSGDTSRKITIEDLPNEILWKIAEYLSGIKDLLSFRLTCSTFWSIIMPEFFIQQGFYLPSGNYFNYTTKCLQQLKAINLTNEIRNQKFKIPIQLPLHLRLFPVINPSDKQLSPKEYLKALFNNGKDSDIPRITVLSLQSYAGESTLFEDIELLVRNSAKDIQEIVLPSAFNNREILETLNKLFPHIKAITVTNFNPNFNNTAIPYIEAFFKSIKILQLFPNVNTLTLKGCPRNCSNENFNLLLRQTTLTYHSNMKSNLNLQSLNTGNLPLTTNVLEFIGQCCKLESLTFSILALCIVFHTYSAVIWNQLHKRLSLLKNLTNLKTLTINAFKEIPAKIPNNQLENFANTLKNLLEALPNLRELKLSLHLFKSKSLTEVSGAFDDLRLAFPNRKIEIFSSYLAT